MHVLVTGCTGFVGFHTALMLQRMGHSVRFGVRSEEKMRRVYQDFDVDLSDFAVGCVTDTEAVSRALDGVDAVVHCAALVTLDANMADELIENNVGGTRNVIGGAVDRGIRSIVFVSSISAMYQPGATIDEHSPYSEAGTAYGRSKLLADQYVRDLIAGGADIAITYPTGIIGPDDPGLSDANEGIAFCYRNGFVSTSTGSQFIDVRDLARAHVKLLERSASGRYIVAGHYRSWDDIHALHETIAGKKLRRLPLPGWLLRLIGRAVDNVKRVRAFDTPLTYEAAVYATQAAIGDDNKLREELDITLTPLRDTFADTVAWLIAKGHIDPP